MAEEPSLSYYLPIAGGRIIGFIPFPRVLVLCEMQSVSSRIWTRIAVFISYGDNDYTTGTSTMRRYCLDVKTPQARLISTHELQQRWMKLWELLISKHSSESKVLQYIKLFHISSISTFLQKPSLKVYEDVNWWCFVKDPVLPTIYKCLAIVWPFQTRLHLSQQKLSLTLVCLRGSCCLPWNIWISFGPYFHW